jgi:hypothetical protein
VTAKKEGKGDKRHGGLKRTHQSVMPSILFACAKNYGVDHVLPEASILQDRLYQLQLLLQQRWLAMYPFEQNTEYAATCYWA